MNTEAKIGKIVGNVGEHWWGQVHDYIPVGQHQIKGRLVAAVSLESPDDSGQVKMVEIGREVLTRLHELYYGSENPDLFASLKLALGQINDEYEGVQAAAVVIVGKILYVSCIRGGVWANVAGKEGWVVKSEDAVVSASGFAKPGELLIAGNSHFWKNIPEGILKATASNAAADLEGAVEMLAAVKHGQADTGGEVGVVIKIEKVEAEAEKFVVEEPKTEVMQPDRVEDKPEIRFKPESKIKIKTREAWGKLWQKLPKFGGSVYVNPGDKSAGRRKMMMVGVGFVVLLFALVGIGSIRNKYKAEQSSETQLRIDQLVYNYNEAQALVGINNLRSRQLLTEVEQTLTEMETEGIKDSSLEEIRNNLSSLLENVSGIKRVATDEIINLSLIRDDLRGDQIEISDSSLYILDVGGSRLVKVDPGRKNGDVISGKNVIGDVKKIAWYPGKIEVLNSEEVIEVNESGQNGKSVLKSDLKWQGVTDIEMYGGNLYILDATAGKIWRHAGLDSGFGAASDWIAEDNEGVAGDVSMAIDGSIWTIGSGIGSIKKYTRGVKDVFLAEEIGSFGETSDLGIGLVIFASEESENIYVLDRDNKRIVMWKKSGELIGQLVNDEIGEAQDFGVNEKSNMIYLVVGSRVLGINK